jgi:cyclophilin family peptidyl-prolyl cis-trans isomerase
MLVISLLLWALGAPADQARGAKPKPAPAPQPYTTDLKLEEMTNKQAVVNTSAGTFVIDLRPDLAPNHVGYFMKLAREGAYNGTTFHRVIRHGIIQGGDPNSKDRTKTSQYGFGGLGVLRAEISAEPATRGAVAAVIQPGRPDSAGAQFFVTVTDQPQLTGKFTVFGRVSEGMDVVQKISEVPNADGIASERVEIGSVTIRDAPPPEPEPFSTETPEELGQYRAVIETANGPIMIELMPDKAPGHVRAFLRLAQAGVFDGTSFHRVVKGFVIQGGSLDTRGALSERQQKLVRNLEPEFNDTPHVKGIVSMARGDDPASATTSFFIVTGDAGSLDGKYTAFGRVVSGMPVVEQIEQSPVSGETPVNRVGIKAVYTVKVGVQKEATFNTVQQGTQRSVR